MILDLHKFMLSIAKETWYKLTINPDRSKQKNHYYFLEHRDEYINSLMHICVSYNVMLNTTTKDFILVEYTGSSSKLFDNRSITCEDDVRKFLLFLTHLINEYHKE